MIPHPTALTLILCDSIIVEVGTRKASLIGCARRIFRDRFPSLPQPFSVFPCFPEAGKMVRSNCAFQRPKTSG